MKLLLKSVLLVNSFFIGNATINVIVAWQKIKIKGCGSIYRFVISQAKKIGLLLNI